MTTRQLTVTAMLTALLCILGPVTLPLGPVPLSLTTGVLMLMALLLGGARATLCCAVYLVMGLIGLPVFAGFQGGVGALIGPTGGFLLGYPLLTALCGFLCARWTGRGQQVCALLAGTALVYLTGTAWYCVQSGADVTAALMVCVLPFLPGDALKIAAVLTLGNAIKARLKKAGMA